MSLFKRIEGLFFSPKPMFEGLAGRPVWIDALVVLIIALMAFNFIVAPYLQKDQLTLMKDNAAALKQKYGEDRYAQIIERTEHPSPGSRIMQIFIMTPILALVGILLQSLLLLIGGRFLSTQGTYVQPLAALVHAGLINALLGNAIRLALALSRGSLMQTSTSLALLFPHLEVTSPAYILLAQVDLFQLWMFGVLAFGLAAIFKIPQRKAATLSYGVWALKAAANVGIGLIGMSFLR